MAEGLNNEEDLNELDRIWPLGKLLIVPDGGTVLVAGAYEGRYMDYICTRFKPGLVVGFEPQKDKAAIARARVAGFSNAIVIDEGIGVHPCMASLEKVGTDGCRVADHTSQDMVRLNSIKHVLDGHGPFDLFICNMEGYEIPLLAYLWAAGMLPEIRSLAVQFHSPHNMIIPTMLTGLYGAPIYNDFPHWTYWRASNN